MRQNDPLGKHERGMPTATVLRLLKLLYEIEKPLRGTGYQCHVNLITECAYRIAPDGTKEWTRDGLAFYDYASAPADVLEREREFDVEAELETGDIL